MNRTFRALALVGLVAAAIPATLAFAAPPVSGAPRPAAHGAAHGPGAHLLRLADELGLSTQQRTQIQGILEKNRPAHQALRGEMRAAVQKLEGAIEGGATDAVIADLAIEAYEVKQQMKELGKAVKQEIGAVLTPEQKERLKQIRQERKASRDAGGDAGGPGLELNGLDL